MYQTFKDAPVLGSLINPKRSHSAKIAKWEELESVLADTLKQDERLKVETTTELHSRTEQKEAGIVAQGLVKAAKLLSMQYSWVLTNVPYLAKGKQHETLKEFCENYYPEGKNDLATAFLDRCLEFCIEGGTSSIVLPQNWLFLTSYRKFRTKLLTNDTWNLVARLGAQAFQTPMWDFNVQLLTLSRGQVEIDDGTPPEYQLKGIDVSAPKTPQNKAEQLVSNDLKTVFQAEQLKNPDAAIIFSENSEKLRLNQFSKGLAGILNGDSARFQRQFQEFSKRPNEFVFQQGTVNEKVHFGGMEKVIEYDEENGHLPLPREFRRKRLHDSDQRGNSAWGKWGVAISQMSTLPSSLYVGNKFDSNVAVVTPESSKNTAAIWCYCSDDDYNYQVREIDQKLNVTNATLVKVPFDLEYWQKVADNRYPNGLPLPYSNDPTQWIFHGHPCASVTWDEEKKWTVESEHRIDETVLQVAVARLLGYQWPAELDPDMELADEQRAIVERCRAFASYADNDGIVCIPAVWKEEPAELRLEGILEVAYGSAWTANLKNKLLQSVGSKSVTAWLRDKFFEQHCKQFQQRPFIWHIWDGLKDGFSVLVNYHKLDKAGLERLIYTYLGDWIRTQQAGVNDGVDGADVRLAAAQTLKTELEKILEGEKPYDIFVRWKPLSKQPIGWEPDLNDGVRLNIRPFMLANDMGKKGAGVLRVKPSSIKWTKDRGTDVETAPWYHLGPVYGEKEGARINEHHLSLAEKQAARDKEA